MLDDFALEVDRHRHRRIVLDGANESGDRLALERHGQQTVNETILEEHRSETGSDDGPDAAADQSHHGECLQAAHSEIFSSDQNRRVSVRRLIEDELGVFGSVWTVAQSFEAMAPRMLVCAWCARVIVWMGRRRMGAVPVYVHVG